MRRTTRIANWPEVCSVELTNRCIAPRGTLKASQIASPASAANRASTIVEMPGSRPPRKIEIAMSGPNSPTAPIAPMARPNGVLQLAGVAQDRQERAERRGAQRDADDDGLLARGDQPADAHPGREADEPADRWRCGRCGRGTRANSISEPATKNSIASPNCDSVSTNSDGCAQPSTAGPTRMPSSSSNTTMGTRIQRPSAPREQRGEHREQRDDQQRRLEVVHALTLATRAVRRRVGSVRSVGAVRPRWRRGASGSRARRRRSLRGTADLTVEPLHALIELGGGVGGVLEALEQVPPAHACRTCSRSCARGSPRSPSRSCGTAPRRAHRCVPSTGRPAPRGSRAGSCTRSASDSAM